MNILESRQWHDLIEKKSSMYLRGRMSHVDFFQRWAHRRQAQIYSTPLKIYFLKSLKDTGLTSTIVYHFHEESSGATESHPEQRPELTVINVDFDSNTASADIPRPYSHSLYYSWGLCQVTGSTWARNIYRVRAYQHYLANQD